MLALLLACLLSPAFAADLDIEGRYEAVDASARDRSIDDGVEAAIADWPLFIRKVVFPKVRNKIVMPTFFDFAPGEADLTITSDLTGAWTTDLQGTKVRVKRLDGTAVRIRRWMDGDVLRADGTTSQGRSEFWFEWSADGSTLTVTAATHADALPRPVQYRAVYARR